MLSPSHLPLLSELGHRRIFWGTLFQGSVNPDTNADDI
jgi:hypothetical protein